MSFRFHRLVPLLGVLPLFVACGGGGGADDAQPTVSSTAVTDAAYSRIALITVNGSNLDDTVTVASPGCGGMARSTSAPQRMRSHKAPISGFPHGSSAHPPAARSPVGGDFHLNHSYQAALQRGFLAPSPPQRERIPTASMDDAAW
jgi:hypothetical protein